MTRRIMNAPTSRPATTIHGTNVETRADIEEEPPLWLPDLELELGEDMFSDSKSTVCREKSIVHASYISDILRNGASVVVTLQRASVSNILVEILHGRCHVARRY